MIYFTSDNHYGSDINALKYRYRPFESPEEADEKMVELWNATITNDDEVYHLGDFAISDEAVVKFLGKLNYSKIYLIVGNHDYKRGEKILSSNFDGVYYDPTRFHIPSGYNTYDEGDQLWLCHYPLQQHDELYTVTAHIHNLWQIAKRKVNVGVDAWHFKPVELQTILDGRHSENVGHWDANVYPDADISWQWEVSNKIQRDISGGEPTMAILEYMDTFSDAIYDTNY